MLYDAKARNYPDIQEEIGQKEGEYIRTYKPILNTQIPTAADWRKFDVHTLDAREILNDILMTGARGAIPPALLFSWLLDGVSRSFTASGVSVFPP